MRESTKESFEVRYVGPALDTHTMDVRTLAPSLLALADALKSAQHTLDPELPAPRIDITATGSGSFTVSLLATSSFLDTLIDLFTSPALEAGLNARELVALLIAAVLLIVKVAKKKKKPEATPPVDGMVTVRWSDGETLTIPEEAVTIAQDPETRKHLRVFVQPATDEDIDAVEMKTKHNEVVVTKDEVTAFDVPDGPDTQETESTRRALLSLNQPTVSGNYVWRVSDGDVKFSASMNDEDFKARIEAGVERFGHGDQLLVDLHETQYTKPDGSIRVDREIVRVLEHREPPSQRTIPLFDVEDPDDADLDS